MFSVKVEVELPLYFKRASLSHAVANCQYADVAPERVPCDSAASLICEAAAKALIKPSFDCVVYFDKEKKRCHRLE